MSLDDEEWNVEGGPGCFVMTCVMLVASSLILAVVLRMLREGR